MKINHKLILFLVSLQTCNRHKFGAPLSFDRNEWQQVSTDVAFKRNMDNTMDSSTMQHAADNAINRMLTSKNNNPSYIYQTLDSSAEYDEYQLAWHLLGYYVDCSSTNSYGSGCPRQVLYAVYANPSYEGGGIGEYKYYNKNSKKYVCYGSGTCTTKMDCHLASTQWNLLGVFKIENLSQNNGWMEQLFKHEGVCIWGSDTYDFASAMRQNMPTSCTSTTQTLSNGAPLYYSTKPTYGSITLGLYTDSMCSTEYRGNEGFDAFNLSGADQSDWSSFNEALDVYKKCQPCISYDLSNDGFDCYDKAGYTNCNQCMKFSNKASCEVASQNDIALAARQQGLITSSKAYGVTDNGFLKFTPITLNSPMQNFPDLSTSIVICFLGLAAFFSMWRKKTSVGKSNFFACFRSSSGRSGLSTSLGNSKPLSPKKSPRSVSIRSPTKNQQIFFADAWLSALLPVEPPTRVKRPKSTKARSQAPFTFSLEDPPTRAKRSSSTGKARSQASSLYGLFPEPSPTRAAKSGPVRAEQSNPARAEKSRKRSEKIRSVSRTKQGSDAFCDPLNVFDGEESPRPNNSRRASENGPSRSTHAHGRKQELLSDAFCDSLNVFDEQQDNSPSRKSSKAQPKFSRMFS